MPTTIFKDARYFQIIFQTLFLCYGIFYLHWDADGWLYATYFGISILTQFLCELIVPKKNSLAIPILQRLRFGFPSIIISAFGLSLLLKTNYWYVAVLAAVVSIASKYLICYKGKHIFNPSALGIVAAIVFTGKAWFSPGQWGSGIIILFAAVSLGFIIVTRVQKLDVSLVFLISFAGLLFFRQVIYLQWPLDFFVQSISTGSLLLFSFFMITDPKTTPNHKHARIIWAVSIAVAAFYLTSFNFINGAAIWVLIFSQPLIPLLDKAFKEKAFEWKPYPISNQKKLLVSS